MIRSDGKAAPTIFCHGLIGLSSWDLDLGLNRSAGAVASSSLSDFGRVPRAKSDRLLARDTIFKSLTQPRKCKGVARLQQTRWYNPLPLQQQTCLFAQQALQNP